MMTDLSNSSADCVQLLELQTDTALDAWKSFEELCPLRLVDAEDFGLYGPGKVSQAFLAVKAIMITFAKILWASPYSIWGLVLGGVGLLTGGGVQWSGRVLEFWGGFLPLFLKYFPFVAGSPVATFGHIVLGRSQRHLEACRPHQLVHVGQYERWGLLFVPAYLTWWYVRQYQNKHPYYDNPFERQAFDETKYLLG